jgi:hypothetical protein
LNVSALLIDLGTQNTPLKEIKPSLAINTDLELSQLGSERSPEIEKKEFSLPQDSSVSKIEYKALLPQYKEFSSDSEMSKTKDLRQVKRKDTSLSTKKSFSEDPQILISNTPSNSIAHKPTPKSFHKVLVSRRSHVKPTAPCLYQSWSSQPSRPEHPLPIEFSKNLASLK